MTTSHSHPEKEQENACFDLLVAASLWIGAVCLVCAVNYGAIHGVNPQLHGIFVMLHFYYGKWVVAGLALFVGAGMGLSALRRMKTPPAQAPFRQGAVYLDTARWYRSSPPKRTAAVRRAHR